MDRLSTMGQSALTRYACVKYAKFEISHVVQCTE